MVTALQSHSLLEPELASNAQGRQWPSQQHEAPRHTGLASLPIYISVSANHYSKVPTQQERGSTFLLNSFLSPHQAKVSISELKMLELVLFSISNCSGKNEIHPHGTLSGPVLPRFCTPNAGDPGSIHEQGTSFLIWQQNSVCCK